MTSLSKTLSRFGLNKVSYTCTHRKRIQSLYTHAPRTGIILCLACAMETWPEPEDRKKHWCTELGGHIDYSYGIATKGKEGI